MPTSYIFFFLPSFLPFSLSIYISITDGKVWHHNAQPVVTNDSLVEEDEWTMEVDLRSGEKEKRTVHWFVNDEQQTGFIKGVPAEVEFGV